MDESFQTTPSGLKKRNRMVEALIKKYSRRHAAIAVAIGQLPTLLPGANFLARELKRQAAAAIYQSLAGEIGWVYLAPLEEINRAQIHIVPMMAVTAGIDIAAEFGTEFCAKLTKDCLAELTKDYLPELADYLPELVSEAADAITVPIIGTVMAVPRDWLIATVMTNLVGRMASVFFQNGAQWVGSKWETYNAVKTITSLSDIGTIPDVHATHLKNVMFMVDMMRKYMTESEIRCALQEKDVPDDLIKEALARLPLKKQPSKRLIDFISGVRAQIRTALGRIDLRR